MVLRLNKTDTDFDSDFARLLNMKREQDEDVNLAERLPRRLQQRLELLVDHA